MENIEVKNEFNIKNFNEDFFDFKNEILKGEKDFKMNYDSIMFYLIKREINYLEELFLNSSEKLNEKMKECILFKSLTKLHFFQENSSKIKFFLIYKNKIKSLDLKTQNPIHFWKSLLTFFENKNTPTLVKKLATKPKPKQRRILAPPSGKTV